MNGSDPFGRNPLLIAVEKGDVDEVRLLIETGADPTAEDIRGRTALSAAKELGFDDIIDLLGEVACN